MGDLIGVDCCRSSCDGGRCELRGVDARLSVTWEGRELCLCRALRTGGLGSSTSEDSSTLSESNLPYYILHCQPPTVIVNLQLIGISTYRSQLLTHRETGAYIARVFNGFQLRLEFEALVPCFLIFCCNGYDRLLRHPVDLHPTEDIKEALQEMTLDDLSDHVADKSFGRKLRNF